MTDVTKEQRKKMELRLKEQKQKAEAEEFAEEEAQAAAITVHMRGALYDRAEVVVAALVSMADEHYGVEAFLEGCSGCGKARPIPLVVKNLPGSRIELDLCDPGETPEGWLGWQADDYDQTGYLCPECKFKVPGVQRADDDESDDNDNDNNQTEETDGSQG